MVTGIDIVREMLTIAAGEPLRLQQGDIALRGAAIECRINAEDMARNFAPSLGTVAALHWPAGIGLRVESQMFAGFQVPPYYDSMLAKLIAWDESRAQAIARMRGALREMKVEGISTTQSLHEALLADPQVHAADFHTGFLEVWLAARSAAGPAA
jgi:acetyl-CoA carboxylase biotin carboxylase subunit